MVYRERVSVPTTGLRWYVPRERSLFLETIRGARSLRDPGSCFDVVAIVVLCNQKWISMKSNGNSNEESDAD